MKNTSFERLASILTNDNSTSITVKTDPITSEVLLSFHIGMTGVWYTICIAGICTNVFNLKTFTTMGLKDSVTISFFCLAVSDLNFCGIAFFEMLVFLCDILQRIYGWHFYLPPLTATLYMLCVRKIFNTTTIMITTFLAVQRCLCVVLPFHVRGMFTRSRTAAFIVVVFTFSTTVSVLYMWRQQLVPGMNAARNKSELQLQVLPGSEVYHFLMTVFIGSSLNLTCQVIVMICLVVMGVVLRKSAKFRQSATVRVTNKAKDTADSSETEKAKAGSQSKEKTKDSQALVQVTLVSTIFVISYLPYLGSGLTFAFVPEYGLYKPFHNLCYLVHNVIFTMELLNSSVNLVVYYNYNTKFRKCFPFGKHKK